MKLFIKQNSAYLAWAIALLSMVGSLYFSEVKNFAPCILCWFQRMAIYPLVFLIPVGILRKDTKLADYVLPLSIIGLAISIFHNLLYYKVIPEAVAPCVNGVSCTTHFVEYFGFITIPLLSFFALALITTLMFVHKKSHAN